MDGMISQDLGAHTAALLHGETTLYHQVARRIAELIEHGTLRPGERIPSVRQCGQQQKVSVATITQAYQLLEDRGLIEGRPQSGYYVRAQRWTPPPEPEVSRPSPQATQVNISDLVMEVIKAGRDPGLVRLGASLPSPELFPIRDLHRALAAAGRRAPQAVHSYEALGYPALRVQVARRTLEAGCTLAPDDIISTVGATEALNLCLKAVTRPGDVVAVESPTFFGLLHIIDSLGLRVCEIPTHPREGVCLKDLESSIKCCRIKACVFALNYSNPLGSCMPDEKKKALVQLLAKREIPLIEDDVYGSLTFGPNRPRAAKAYDQGGWVMLCDSFTKTLSPGYRVGWVAPGRFKAQVEFQKYVHTAASPALLQMAIAEFLQNGGFDHHLRRIRRAYASQAEQMSAAIGRYFPSGTKATRPTGGMSIWVELPGQVDTLDMYRQALAAGISLAPGMLFSAKERFNNCLRLSCGNPWSDRIEQAMRQLGQIATRLAAEAPRRKLPARPRLKNSAIVRCGG